MSRNKGDGINGGRMRVGLLIDDEESSEWLEMALDAIEGIELIALVGRDGSDFFGVELLIVDGDHPGEGFVKQFNQLQEFGSVPQMIVLGSPESKMFEEISWEDNEIMFIGKPYEFEEVKHSVARVLAEIVEMRSIHSDEAEKAESQKKQQSGGMGHLSAIQLGDLIQMLCMSQWTGKIDVSNLKSGESGELFLHAGNIIDAQSGDNMGEEACYEMFKWEKNQFDFYEQEESTRKTVSLPWQELLLEGARKLDEQAEKKVL